MSSISSRPHIRAKKMDAWKEAAPLSGYLQWREMQLFMNLQMKAILQEHANISILPSSNKKQLKALKCSDTIKGYADNDPWHDADVKFFLNGSFRIHPESSFFSKKELVENMQEKTTSTTANNSIESDHTNFSIHKTLNSTKNKETSNVETLIPEDTTGNVSASQIKYTPEHSNNKPVILLIGSDLHISIAILYNSNLPKNFPVGTKYGKSSAKSKFNNSSNITSKSTKVEFFDCRGSNVSLSHIKNFFQIIVSCKSFHLINKVNFQEDGNCSGDEGLDIYCNTWIYYWVYLRLVHQISANKIIKNIESMNSKERLEEIDRFQRYLYDLPKQTEVGSGKLFQYTQANPFIMGTIDPNIVNLRLKLQTERKRLTSQSGHNSSKKRKFFNQVSNKNIVNATANRSTGNSGSCHQFVIHRKCKSKRSNNIHRRNEEKWYIKRQGRRVIEHVKVFPKDVPYRFFRSVKNDLITFVKANGLISIINTHCVERLIETRQLENDINVRDLPQNDKWIIFKINNRVKSGKMKGVYNISCKTKDDRKNSAFFKLHLTRSTYGTDWIFLQPLTVAQNKRSSSNDMEINETLRTNIYSNEKLKEIAENESISELEKNKFFLPNMYTGELEEDATNILMCDNIVANNENIVCSNFKHIKALGYESLESIPGYTDGTFKWYCSENCEKVARHTLE
jgi:hypothetical protein